MYEFQKPSFPKRIAAWLIDIVLLLTIALGFNFLMSFITDFDSYSLKLEEIYDKYEAEYNTDFNLLPDTEEFDALDLEAKARYTMAVEKIEQDEEANRLYNMVLSLIILNISISMLIGTLAVEFVVPLILKNGMTPGKKLFGLSVIKTNAVRINSFQLFARALLGKYTIEIMIPVLMIILMVYGNLGMTGLAVLLLLALVQLVLIVVTKKRRPIHDLISDCCVADYSSQSVFNTEAEFEAYNKN